MTNPHFSVPYLDCLLNIKIFQYTQSPAAPRPQGRNRDELFIKSIPVLATFHKIKIPRLEAAAKMKEPIEIYNEDTYMEFHDLVGILLSRFLSSLEQLKKLETDMVKTKNFDLESILAALKKVRASGHYLRAIVSGAAIEKYLQNIAQFLVVDTRKAWPDLVDNDDDDTFFFLKPNSMRKGQAIVSWQSYRDWLKLMVLYFDAAQVLASFIASLKRQPPVPISILILSPPHPNDQMPHWEPLLQNERYFSQVPGEPSGKELVDWLHSRFKSSKTGDSIATIIKSAQLLNDPSPSDAKIDLLATQMENCSSLGADQDIAVITKRIIALKLLKSQDRPSQVQKILELLTTFQRRATFYKKLSLEGLGAPGTQHCEAYVASILTLLGLLSGQTSEISEFEARVKELSKEQVEQLKDVLGKFAVSHGFMLILKSLLIE